MAIPIST
jgi:hypothetical protein